MKICISAPLFYNVGVAETAFHYSQINNKEFDLVFSGYIEKRVAERVKVIGKPDPLSFDDDNSNARWYPITNENSRGIDLFVFYFDHGNFFESEQGEKELERIISITPREKRVVVDADGKYNQTYEYEGDKNHQSEESRKRWFSTFELLSDRIFQPSLKISNQKVRFLPFWGYKEPIKTRQKKYDVLYLGSNWFRMERVIKFMDNFTNLRSNFPNIAVLGKNWLMPDSYWPEATKQNREFFNNREIELIEYMTDFGEFTELLSGSRFSPILIRPVLGKMGLITPRMFETFASGTIPILTNDFDYASKIYGDVVQELMLGEDPIKKLEDMSKREEYYNKIAKEIREKLRKEHSFERRLEELSNLV